METHPFEFVDGHIVATMGGARVLMDTGSPVSFGDVGTLRILGVDHPAAPDLMGIGAARIGGWIGTRIDCLLGGDILGQAAVAIDSREGTITFSREPGMPEGVILPLEILLGVPLVGIRAGNRDSKVCLDTGARLSYLPSAALNGGTPCGETTDFFPALGTFSTPIFRVPVKIAGAGFELTSGKLPALLASTLTWSGIDGVVGTEIFETFPRIGFDYRGKRVILSGR